MSTRHERREQRLKERRKQGTRRVTAKRVTPRWVTPAIIAAVAVVAILGLRQLGVFEPPPPPFEIDDVPPVTGEVGTREPNAGNAHTPQRGVQVTYTKVPPTSGNHWEMPHAGWGVKDESVEDELVVHNLEHGGIAIQYKPGLPPQELADLKTLVRQLNAGQYRKVLLRPYIEMEPNIVLTAWTWRHELQSFDRDQIVNFVRSHHGASGNAPEPNAQ